MKKILTIFALAAVLASCKNTDKQGIAEDNARKAVIDSMKAVAEQQRIIDSMNIEVAKAKQAKEAAESRRQTVVVHDNAAATPAEAKRKGMSGAAKGALIGAGVGAITGAVVSDKKGQGAIIGGLAGAGVGAGTGAIIDNEKKKKEQK